MATLTAFVDGVGPLSSLDAGLGAATGVLAAIVGCWAVLVLVLAVAARVAASAGGRGGVRLERALGLLTPGLAGRVLRAAIGVGTAGTGLLAAGFAAPVASATAVHVPATSTGHPTSTADPTSTANPTSTADLKSIPNVGTPATDPASAVPGPPERAGGDLWPLSTPTRTSTRIGGDHAETVVRRGDTLWSIAARQLPAYASDSRIDALWRRWYAHNRAVIGTDPNVLLPGQVLRAPF